MSLISVKAQYNWRCDYCPGDKAEAAHWNVSLTVPAKKFEQDGWDEVERALDEKFLERLPKNSWHVVIGQNGELKHMCRYCALRMEFIKHETDPGGTIELKKGA